MAYKMDFIMCHVIRNITLLTICVYIYIYVCVYALANQFMTNRFNTLFFVYYIINHGLHHIFCHVMYMRVCICICILLYIVYHIPLVSILDIPAIGSFLKYLVYDMCSLSWIY